MLSGYIRKSFANEKIRTRRVFLAVFYSEKANMDGMERHRRIAKALVSFSYSMVSDTKETSGLFGILTQIIFWGGLMKKSRIALVVAVALAFVCALSSCGGQPGAEEKKNATEAPSQEVSAVKVLESEECELPSDFDLLKLTEDNVESRRVTETTKDFEEDLNYCVDFSNENMALSVPLSLISEAAEVNSNIVMRYHYPEGNDQKSIGFYFPVVEEYELYFPGSTAEEVSLVVGDVIVADSQSESVCSRFEQQGCVVEEDAAVYSVEMGLVYETADEISVVKLDMIMDELVMREEGVIDEAELNSRLYINNEDAVCSVNKTAYLSNSTPEKSFVDSYFYGSSFSTQGTLSEANYDDIQGHYAEGAIRQAQSSFSMASAITQGDSFNPDQEADITDVFEAFGTFYAIPLMNAEVYETIKPQLVEEYAVDDFYQAYFVSDDDYLVNNYASRVPYGYAEMYRSLAQQDELEYVLDKNPALNSRVNIALMQLGSLADNPGILNNENFLTDPSEEEVDQWLLGITDVDDADPLRPAVALAVHYGLIAPDAEGKLNLYEPITRADLCLSYVNFATLIRDTAEDDQDIAGYTRQYLRVSDEAMFYDVNGAWELVEATRADGSTYTAEEIADEEAFFEFRLGNSEESWTGESYSGTYWFSLKDRIMMIGYENGEFEPLELDESLTHLTYHYINDADPEFSGETYVFERW